MLSFKIRAQESQITITPAFVKWNKTEIQLFIYRLDISWPQEDANLDNSTSYTEDLILCKYIIKELRHHWGNYITVIFFPKELHFLPENIKRNVNKNNISISVGITFRKICKLQARDQMQSLPWFCSKNNLYIIKGFLKLWWI